MNFHTSFVLLGILVVLYLILIEVFTVLYRFQGIASDKARFQATSLLTATGFTTKESELLLLNKKRRRLTQITMLFGYIFNLTIISTFINIFRLSSSATRNDWFLAGIFVGVMIIIIEICNKKIHWHQYIEKLLKKINKPNKKNRIDIYDEYAGKVIAEVEINNLNDNIVNKSIVEMKLKENFGIQLLVIIRKGNIINYIDPKEQLKKNDTILIFGRNKDIKKFFKC